MIRCCECGGDGGFYRGREWRRCEPCYGFGYRSYAADLWFKSLVATTIITP